MSYTVYMHTFPNGKKYIGITKDLKRRWRCNGVEYSTKYIIGKAIKKYGWDNIEHKIMSNWHTQEEAEKLERYLVEKYKSNDREYGYNLTNGGEKQKEYSIDVRRRMSEAQLGKTISIETRKKLSEIGKGRKFSESHLAKLRALGQKRVGIQRDEEIGKKVSRTLRSKEMGRKVGQYSLEGDLIKIHKSVRYALEMLGKKTNNGGIKGCLNGKYYTYLGYQWKYIDEKIEVNIPSVKVGEKKRRYKAILKYSLDGKLIQRFDSATGAMRELGLGSSIMHCCRGLSNTAYGFQWKYENDDVTIIETKKVGEKKKARKAVNQFSIDGNFIKRYGSAQQATKEFSTSKKSSLITSVCQGRQKTAYGYKWEYAEDTP